MRGTWTVVTLPKDLRRFGHNLSPPSPIRAIPICGSTSTRGIDYRTVNVDELRDSAADELRALGFAQLPVVQAAGMASWSGFRPDRIESIHLDVSQSYRDGAFWTRCSCGQEFRGIDPDDADAVAYEHCFPEGVTR